jgi:competence protein ComEA
MRFVVALLCVIVVGLGASAPAAADSPQQPPAAAAKASDAVPLNINTATAAQLEKLPGIGPRTAARIIEYRQKNGGFKKVEELMNVRGLAEKSFLRLKSQVTVAPPKPDAP